MPSYIVRPVLDNKAAWTEVPAGAAWTTLDEVVTQPTAPDTSDRIETTNNSLVTNVGVGIVPIPDTEAVTEATVWAYVKATTTVSFQLQLFRGAGIDIGIGEGISPTAEYTDTSYGWASSTYSGQGSLSNSELGLLSIYFGNANGEVAAAYVELITEYLYVPDPQVGPGP